MDNLLGLVRPDLRAIEAYSPPAREQGIVLDANEHSHPLPKEVREGLARELAKVELHRYPAVAQLQSYLAGDLGIDKSWVTLGNGSDELLSLLCATFANPRKGRAVGGVLFPSPSFSVYPIAGRSAGLDVFEVPLADGFVLDMAAMRSAIEKHKPNLVFLARPNNPTGTFWPEEQLLELVGAFEDVLFVSDEAYCDYGAQGSLAQLAKHKNLLILRTVSKMGLAALRVGYLCGHPDLITEVNKVRGPYNIGSLNICSVMYLLSEHRDWMLARCDDVVVAREGLCTELQKFGDLEVFPSSANFILVRVVTGTSRFEKLKEAFVKNRIWVRSFSREKALADCLRITIGTAEENQAVLDTVRKNLS